MQETSKPEVCLMDDRNLYTGERKDGKGGTLTDPVFLLDVEGLKKRHVRWESERRRRWAGVSRRASAIRGLLADATIGASPAVRVR